MYIYLTKLQFFCILLKIYQCLSGLLSCYTHSAPDGRLVFGDRQDISHSTGNGFQAFPAFALEQRGSTTSLGNVTLCSLH